MSGSSVIHLLLTLPKQAWWLIAILAGLSLLSGGSKGKKKKKKKKDDDSSGMIGVVLVAGALLVAAGASGGALKVPAVHHTVTRVFGLGSCSGIGSVPASMINGAADKLHISCKVVRAQINEESGGSPTAASPVAYGVAQFEPGTWRSHHCPGSWWNVGDSMNCYVVYMRELIGSEGSLRNALAAYNAGPGNLPAGYGYADTILSAAGQ